MIAVRRLFPSFVTAIGLACGLVALAVSLSPIVAATFLLLSLVCDAADGYVARRFRAVTRFGGLFDWTTDVALSFAIAWVFFPFVWAAVATCALVFVQTLARWSSVRASGRFAVTVAAVLHMAGAAL